MANGKRDVKEMGNARDLVYSVVESNIQDALTNANYEIVGRGVEGLILRDKQTDLYVVVKAIAKAIDFDAEDAMEAYQDAANKAVLRAEKSKAKAAKDIAKRAKAKEEDAQ